LVSPFRLLDARPGYSLQQLFCAEMKTSFGAWLGGLGAAVEAQSPGGTNCGSEKWLFFVILLLTFFFW
jgi:hypothetical protein